VPAQISDIGEAIAALTGLGPDQLILLIILAEIVIVGGALWILNKVIQAMHASAEAMRQKVEADVAQTVKLSEMSANIGRMVEADGKKLDLALKTLDEARGARADITTLNKTVERELADLQNAIRQSDERVTNKLLQRFEELWKRFDAVEAEAKRYSEKEGSRIVEAVERAKLELLKQLQVFVHNTQQEAKSQKEGKVDEPVAE
jgi:hypothetical protein